MRASTSSTCARARKQGTITAISGTLGIRGAHGTKRASRSHARPPLDSARKRRLERSPALQPETATEAGVGVVRASWSQALVLRSEEHTSELQSLRHLVCRLLLEKKKI